MKLNGQAEFCPTKLFETRDEDPRLNLWMDAFEGKKVTNSPPKFVMSSNRLEGSIVRNTLSRMELKKQEEAKLKQMVEMPKRQRTDIRQVFGLK